MDYQTLRFEIAEGIATITLDQKDNPANTLDARMAEEVFEVSLRCGAPEVRAVILTAVGQACAFDPHGDLAACGAVAPGAY